MEYLIVIVTTVVIASLTFLSGFGLGTLLLPVFILFFPVDVAIACTAIVHLANNIFKAFLAGKHADLGVVWKFSIPGAIFALIGALLLEKVVSIPPLHSYELFGHVFSITPVKLIVAILMAVFCIIEFLPSMKNLAFDAKWIPLGGGVSGFFGGLTGHQGALRAAFLVRLGLDKETFVGTTILSSILIDVSRLVVYGTTFLTQDFSVLAGQGQIGLIFAGIVGAFLGAVLGYFFVKKSTLELIHNIIGILLLVYSITLGVGLI